MYESIQSICENLATEFNSIPKERKEKLQSLADYISRTYTAKETPKLIVVCTHNSRRSHIGQIWLAVGADYFGLPTIETFSGGTEATAFNPRAVNAVQNAGFKVKVKQSEKTNPHYQITWKKGMEPYSAFSKKYDDQPNPSEKFGAIMVCTEADKGCPIITGCDFRLALPFNDPKAFDDTDLETEKYSERLLDIGREVLFALSLVKINKV